jgi:hypothetical protein
MAGLLFNGLLFTDPKLYSSTIFTSASFCCGQNDLIFVAVGSAQKVSVVILDFFTDAIAPKPLAISANCFSLLKLNSRPYYVKFINFGGFHFRQLLLKFLHFECP